MAKTMGPLGDGSETRRRAGDANVGRLGSLTRQLQERSPGAFKLGVALLRLLAGRLLRMNEQFLELQSKTEGHQKSEIERLRERILHDWSF